MIRFLIVLAVALVSSAAAAQTDSPGVLVQNGRTADSSFGSPGFGSSWLPAWDVPASFVLESPLEAKNWSLGIYGGVYNTSRLPSFFFAPWVVAPASRWRDGYLGAVNADVTLLHIPDVPLDLEMDFSIAYHFNNQNFAEFGAVPLLRWKWFPWNKFVDTTFAVGLLGSSYTTSISRLETADTRDYHTSRYLNLIIGEWTFALPNDPTWEAVLRLQHRSGIYGMINNVSGGSNYVNVGIRKHF